MARKSSSASTTATTATKRGAAKKTTPAKSGAKKSTTAAKSSGVKSSAKKSSGATAAKKSTTPSTPVASSAKPGTFVVRRFEQHQDAAHAATKLMRHGGRNGGRAPVATSNVADVIEALAGRAPADLLGVSTAQLTKLARGEKIAEKTADAAKSAAREFSGDAFGRASTKNKLRGAKLLAILAVVANAPEPVKSAAKSSAAKTATKRTGSKRTAK